MLRDGLNPRARRLPAFVKGMLPTKIRVDGLDLSLNGSGVANIRGNSVQHKTIKPKPQSLRAAPRLDYLERVLKNHFTATDPDLVVVEGYSFGSKNGRERIGEWVV